MLCIKDYKGKLLQKHLTSFQRNCLDTHNKKESNKKFKKLKWKDVKDKLNKLVNEMHNRLSELDNNVYMNK